MAEYILHKTKEETTLRTKKMYVSTPYNRVQAVEERLKKIFEDEKKSEGSILIDYNPQVLSKLAKYLSGHISRPASIGIAGETASGKSTITLDIIDTIKSFATEFEIEDAITRVNTDDYYYDRSEMVKAAGSFAGFAKNYDLDVPQALELELVSAHSKELLMGKSVFLPLCRFIITKFTFFLWHSWHASQSFMIIYPNSAHYAAFPYQKGVR